MIAFIAAERREFQGLLPHLKNVRKLRLAVQWALSGELNGKSVILAANGPGRVLAGSAADAVKEFERLDALVSYGFCGGLDPALSVNDIFVASEIFNPTWRTLSSVPRRHSCRRLGKLLSINHVVCTSREKSELRKTGADAVEMEAAGVASRAPTWKVPFYCIRVVTDTANEEFALDFNALRNSDGRFSRSKIIAAAARNPLKLVPELMKLDFRTKSAAKALGDFVAACEF